MFHVLGIIGCGRSPPLDCRLSGARIYAKLENCSYFKVSFYRHYIFPLEFVLCSKALWTRKSTTLKMDSLSQPAKVSQKYSKAKHEISIMAVCLFIRTSSSPLNTYAERVYRPIIVVLFPKGALNVSIIQSRTFSVTLSRSPNEDHLLSIEVIGFECMPSKV